MKLRSYTFLLFGVVLLSSLAGNAQGTPIRWMTFEQLEDSLAIQPKKVFIDFYADWCVYCKKMDQAAFKNPKVISTLNSDYYAVRMNAESTDTIEFGGQTYVNLEKGKKRNPTHEIPLLLASRKHFPFSLPAMVVLNDKFEVTDRFFEYLSPKQLSRALEDQ